MSTITRNDSPAFEATGLSAALDSFFQRLVAARMRRAEAAVRPYLARLPDEQLAEFGFTPAKIAAIREGTQAPTFIRV